MIVLRLHRPFVVDRPLSSWIFGYVLILAVAVPAAAEKVQPKPPDPLPSASAKAPSASDTGTHELSRADLEAFLDGFVPYALKNADIAGLTLVVVKDGQILFKKGYGYADVRTNRAMDPGLTLVRTGSTSKLFTWTAVMQLVEQGKLDRDRYINDYPGFRVNSSFLKPITMRNLMTHRAGFEEGLKSILTYDPKQFITTEGYLKNHRRPTLFPPGEVPAYSSYGAVLAGYRLSSGGRELVSKNLLPGDFPSAQLVVPRQVIFKSEDGLTIHGQLFVPRNGKQRNPAQIFTHGGPVR
jgi:hypothetical protein